jgi:hypothetical protein
VKPAAEQFLADLDQVRAGLAEAGLDESARQIAEVDLSGGFGSAGRSLNAFLILHRLKD